MLPDKKQRQELKEMSAYKAIVLDCDEADADGIKAKKTQVNDSQVSFAQTQTTTQLNLQEDFSLNQTNSIIVKDYDV